MFSSNHIFSPFLPPSCHIACVSVTLPSPILKFIIQLRCILNQNFMLNSFLVSEWIKNHFSSTSPTLKIGCLMTTIVGISKTNKGISKCETLLFDRGQSLYMSAESYRNEICSTECQCNLQTRNIERSINLRV